MLLDAEVSERNSGKRLLGALIGLPLGLALILLIRMPLSWSDQAIFSGLLILWFLAASANPGISPQS